VAERLGLKPKLICSGSRQKKIAEARALVAYLAVEETGHSAAEVARHLGVRRVNVLRAAKKGLKIGNKFDDERTV
jgi:chromosomal replication initiation ATPase DnaA